MVSFNVFQLPTVDWDTREVGFLHSAFYIGFMITHVPGGYLTTIWPSHRYLYSLLLLLLFKYMMYLVRQHTCLSRIQI